MTDEIKKRKPRRKPKEGVIVPQNPRGRPEIPIDWAKVEQLLTCGCKGTEIAASLNINNDTLYERVLNEKGILFTEYAARFKETGKTLLRQAQFNKALGITKLGDTTMQIWLGKQNLDQKENKDVQVFSEEAIDTLEEYTQMLRKAREDHLARNIEDNTTNKDQ